MLDIPRQPNGLILVRSLRDVNVDDRQLRGARARGDLHRIRRGAYADANLMSSAGDDERYDLRIAAVLGTRHSPVVASHYSAARVWGFPIANPWPWEVHVTVDPESAKRTKNGVVVHRYPLTDEEIVELDGVLVTSRLRTLIDLCRIAAFRDAVVALDNALASDVVPLIKKDLVAALDAQGTVRGAVRAGRAIDFATPLAASPGESFSRVLMHELGFPAPELQHEFRIATGGRRFADFWWEYLRLIGEFDGQGKYFDPLYTHGRTPQQVFWNEKQRENELREQNTGLVRWDWALLRNPAAFIRRLESAGLRRH